MRSLINPGSGRKMAKRHILITQKKSAISSECAFASEIFYERNKHRATPGLVLMWTAHHSHLGFLGLLLGFVHLRVYACVVARANRSSGPSPPQLSRGPPSADVFVAVISRPIDTKMTHLKHAQALGSPPKCLVSSRCNVKIAITGRNRVIELRGRP